MERTKAGNMFTALLLEIFKANGMLNNEGDRLTKELGITSSRWKILGAIDMSATPITVSEIGRTMGQSRQAVQRLADIMVKDGLLTFVDNPNHKRAKYVMLTSKAKETVKLINIKQIPWANKIGDSFSDEELESSLLTVRKMVHILEEE